MCAPPVTVRGSGGVLIGAPVTCFCIYLEFKMNIHKLNNLILLMTHTCTCTSDITIV